MSLPIMVCQGDEPPETWDLPIMVCQGKELPKTWDLPIMVCQGDEFTNHGVSGGWAT